MPIWSQCLFKITPLTLLLLSLSLIFNLLTDTFPSDFLSSLAELPTLMIWLQFLLSSSQTNIPTLPTSDLDLPYRVSYQWSPTWISQLHRILSAHSQGVKTALSSPSQTEILVRFWFTLLLTTTHRRHTWTTYMCRTEQELHPETETKCKVNVKGEWISAPKQEPSQTPSPSADAPLSPEPPLSPCSERQTSRHRLLMGSPQGRAFHP